MLLYKKRATSALNVKSWSEASSSVEVVELGLQSKKVDFWVNAYCENIYNCEYVLLNNSYGIPTLHLQTGAQDCHDSKTKPNLGPLRSPYLGVG